MTPNTSLQLTATRRASIERHWQQLDQLRRQTQRWRPEDQCLAEDEEPRERVISGLMAAGEEEGHAPAGCYLRPINRAV